MAYTIGTSSSAQSISRSAECRPWTSGGVGIAYTAQLSAAPHAAAISLKRGRSAAASGTMIRGFEVPRSMAANWAIGAKPASSSCGCAIDMTKSMAGSFSCSAAISSTSASVTGRRSRAPGPSRYRQSEPVP